MLVTLVRSIFEGVELDEQEEDEDEEDEEELGWFCWLPELLLMVGSDFTWHQELEPDEPEEPEDGESNESESGFGCTMSRDSGLLLLFIMLLCCC